MSGPDAGARGRARDSVRYQRRARLDTLSLFSGAGLLDLGLTQAGFRIAQQVELDPFASAILHKRFPRTWTWRDVRTFHAPAGRFDVVAGGFPCQDLSNANTAAKGRGGLQGDKSGLWREMRRIIKEAAPTWAITENAGAWRRWVPDVRRDLWALGYASVPLRLRADSFGAPHGRDRVFIVAHADRQGEPLRALHEEVARLCPVSGAVRDGRPSPPGGFRVDDGTPSGMDRCRVVGEGVDVRVARWLGERIRELA